VFEGPDHDDTSGSGGVVFWLLVFSSISVFLFGWCVPHFVATHGLPVLDLEASHGVARTLELMERYGAAGRSDFLVFLTIDCFFPVAASMFVIAILRRVFAFLGTPERFARVSVVVAATPAVLDLLENGFEAMLVASYPRFSLLLAQASLLATRAKLMTLLATYGLLIAVLLLGARKRLAHKS
jgi:hypothetical protein